MIVLKQNDAKLNELIKKRKELLERYPEFADILVIPNSINDIFTPYSNWIASLTEKDKEELKLVADENLNFDGVYVCRDFNDHYDIEKITDYYEDAHDWHYKYGVVDNATQVLENCEIPENAVVLLTPVIKDKEEPYSGWRWHKWGKYYGVQNRCCEYLNDEPDVEMIYCFRTVQLFETEVT